jgi:hypothetical protein
MKRIIPLLATVFLAVFCAPKQTVVLPESLAGDWSGTIDGVGLAFEIHLGDSCYACSPDQGDIRLALELKEATDSSLRLKIPKVMASYEGTVRGDSLIGHFGQMGKTFPLNLARGKINRNRPQTPQPPFPYATEDVSFSCEDHMLAGTLTLPNQAAEAPVLLLITGSGPQNRDEELMGHKPFAVIADAFAREGIATLRYDDRGTAESTGDFAAATTADFAADAAAGIRFLREKGFRKVGALGHSEGGTIVFLLAGSPDTPEDARPDFIVSMAGMADRGDSTLVRQTEAMLKTQGVPGAVAKLATGKVVRQMKKQKPWGPYFLALDPSEAISATRCPVLALNGEKDMQVIPKYNLDKIRALLPSADTRLYPDLNHLFQHCGTGLSIEYATIEETISPEVLGEMVEWIRNR